MTPAEQVVKALRARADATDANDAAMFSSPPQVVDSDEDRALADFVEAAGVLRFRLAPNYCPDPECATCQMTKPYDSALARLAEVLCPEGGRK